MDRREYHRFRGSLECNIYFKNRDIDYKEFSGLIEDISEVGLRIKIDTKDNVDFVNNITVGDSIMFQSAEEKQIHNEEKITVLIGEARVLRIEEEKEFIKIGCAIVSVIPEYYKYIRYREMQIFR